MTRNEKKASAAATTALILEVFRLNGRLLAAGDGLVSKLGLTSARWQVLGAVALSPTAEPVARLARYMGLNRQGVQRIVNELAEEDIVGFQQNPHHRRAKLVMLTKKGRQAYEAASRLQTPWVNALSNGIDARRIIAASHVIEILRRRLEEEGDERTGEHG
jgi:DNA-binding MarR family transcriptional regulator